MSSRFSIHEEHPYVDIPATANVSHPHMTQLTLQLVDIGALVTHVHQRGRTFQAH